MTGNLSKNKYYWTFQIETSQFGGVMGASCDYVTEENKEAWLRFVENKIREVMKPETMDYLVDFFNELEKEGKLPDETKEFLKKAWQEIMETECHQSYGILNKKML